MYDDRTTLSRQVTADLSELLFGAQVFETVIPRNVRLAEAPGPWEARIIFPCYDIHSKGAEAYIQLAKEVITGVARNALGRGLGALIRETGGAARLPRTIAGAGRYSFTRRCSTR